MAIGDIRFPGAAPAWERDSNPRLQQVTPRLSSGLQGLARGVEQAGGAAADYLEAREERNRQRDYYAALEAYNRMTGEVSRQAQELQREVPADGRGYVEGVDEIYNGRFTEFRDSINPQFVDQFAAQAEQFRQQLLLAGDRFETEALRGATLSSLEKNVSEWEVQVYENPELAADAEEAVAELLTAAPGLAEDERLEIARSAVETIRTASLGGRLRRTEELLTVVPNSTRVRAEIVPAVEFVESSGNPRAVSDAGAIGLMQIMPGTAVEIATRLRDSRFPFKGTDEDQREYLMRPEVSRRYGTFYLNQQLARYGGDLEAALIAYNAGPSRADRWIAAGRDYSVLPGSAAESVPEYVNRVFNRLGLVTRDDAALAGLDLQQRIGVEADIAKIYANAGRDAEGRLAAQQQAATQRSAAAFEQILLRTRQGEDGRALYIDALNSGTITSYNDSDYARLERLFEEVNAERLSQQTAAENFIADPASASNENLNTLSRATLIPGLLAGTEEAIWGTEEQMGIVPLSRQAGRLPDAVAQTLQTMLGSGNYATMDYAAQAIEAVQSEAGLPLNRGEFSTEELAFVAQLNAMRRADLPRQDIERYISRVRTPQGMAEVRSAQEADPQYEENYNITAVDLLEDFRTTIPLLGTVISGPEDVPFGPQRDELVRQYRAAYRTHYAHTLDASLARERAVETLARTWGGTELGYTSRLMQYPPELVYSQIEDENGAVQLSPGQIRRMLIPQVRERLRLREGESFRVDITPRTIAAARTGQPVPYLYTRVDEDGDPVFDLEEGLPLNIIHVFDFGAAVDADIETEEELSAIREELDEFELRMRQVEREEGRSAAWQALSDERDRLKRRELEIFERLRPQ